MRSPKLAVFNGCHPETALKQNYNTKSNNPTVRRIVPLKDCVDAFHCLVRSGE